MHSRSMIGFVVGTLLLSGACTDAPGPTAADPAGREVARELRLSGLPADLIVGDTARLRAVALDGRRRTLPAAHPTWESSDPLVLLVEDGLLVPGAPGRARVHANVDGVSAQASLQVNWQNVTPKTLRASPSSVKLATGAKRQLSAILTYSNQLRLVLRLAVVWETLDSTVARVEQGHVVGIGAGETRLVARVFHLVDTVPVRVSAPAGPRVVDVPASIDATGERDVTMELNAFFASVLDTSTIRFPANARYRVEGTLLFKDRRALTFEGNGATIFAETDGKAVLPQREIAHRWPRKRTHFMFLGGADIILRGVHIIGANPHAGIGDSAFVVELEAQHGVEFAGVDGGELDSVSITDVYGDFVYFGPYNGRRASGIRVHRSHFERNGRQGIAFTGADDILVENNYMADVRRAHFDLEPNFARDTLRRLVIRNNVFGRGRLLFLASGGAAGYIEDVRVENNRLTGKPLNIQVRPPQESRRRHFVVVGNTSDASFGSSAPMMQFNNVDGLIVRNNHNPMTPNRLMTAIRLRASCKIDIDRNAFPGAIEHVLEEVPCPR